MESVITNVSQLITIGEINGAAEVLSDIILPTPLQLNARLSDLYGAEIYLKREDLQVVRSFKIRGAYYKMSRLSKGEAQKGIVCASAGNHAQGVAMACSKLGIDGVIFMPTTTPNQKINRVRAFGGHRVEIRLVGDTFDDSDKEARLFSNASGRPFIHPFNDRDVIAGQGTVAREIINELDTSADFLFTTVGGGGLLAGVSSYFKQVSPQTKIVAVEAEGAPSLKVALEAQKVVALEKIDGFADGIATKQVGSETYAILKDTVDDHVSIPEGQMCQYILSLYNEDAIVVEPACASVIAALEKRKAEIKGKRVVCIMSGGNNDITRMEEIKERAMLFEGKKHYFIVNFPQRAGALREFLNVLGPEDDIARFEYTKKTNRDSGPALIGIELGNPNDFDALIQKMKAEDIDFQHLNENPLLFEMMV